MPTGSLSEHRKTRSPISALILVSLSVSRPNVASTEMFCTISVAGFNWPLLRAWSNVCSGSGSHLAEACSTSPFISLASKPSWNSNPRRNRKPPLSRRCGLCSTDWNGGVNQRDLCRDATRQVRALTGFDRVMVYRFDEDGSGEVVAESTRNGLPSFLGLRYPAADIPAQARPCMNATFCASSSMSTLSRPPSSRRFRRRACRSIFQ